MQRKELNERIQSLRVCLSVYLISNESTYKISNCCCCTLFLLYSCIRIDSVSKFSKSFFRALSVHVGPVVTSECAAICLKRLIVVSEGDLRLVVRLLVIFPRILAVALLLGHAFVLINDGPVMGGNPGSVLVLEHATHTENGFFLRGVALLLLLVGSRLSIPLTALLIGPVLLVLSVELHSISVH